MYDFPNGAAWLNIEINTNLFGSAVQHHIYLNLSVKLLSAFLLLFAERPVECLSGWIVSSQIMWDVV